MLTGPTVLQTPLRRTTRLACAALAVLLTSLAACGGTPDAAPTGSPTPTVPTIGEPVGLPDFAVADDPLWGSEEVDVSASSISFHGDVAVVIGGQKDDSFDWPTVVDADSGAERWSLQNMAHLDGLDATFMAAKGMSVAGKPGAEVLMVGYYSPGCVTQPCPPKNRQSPETGVAGLDLRSGELRWQFPAIGSLDEKSESDEAEELRDLDLQIVGGPHGGPLLVIGPVMGLTGQQYEDPDRFRTIALNPSTGDELWSTPAVAAQQLVGDTVVGLVPPTGPTGNLTHGAGGPVALDLDTGEKIWDLSEDFPEALVTGVSDHQLIISPLQKAFEAFPSLVDLETGTVRRELTKALPTPVFDQETGLLIYRAQDQLERLSTQLPDEQQPSQTGIDVPHSQDPALAIGGYILVSDRGAEQTTAIDRSGTVLSEPMPGHPIAVTDSYLVLQDGSGAGSGFSVYERVGE